MKAIEAVCRLYSWRLILGALAVAFCIGAPATAFAGDTGGTDDYGGVSVLNSVLLDPFDPVPEIQYHHGCEGDCGRHYDHGRDHEGGYDDRGPRCHEECHWHGWYCPHDCDAMYRPGAGEHNLGWWRCSDGCRNGDWWCDHDCRLEAWHCDHDCYIHEPCETRDCRDRPPFPRCDHDCQRDGEHCVDICYGQMVRDYDETLKRYDEQSHWYFEHVMGGDHGHDYDHHDGDHHDSDHRDNGHHDYDRHDGHEPPPPPPPVSMTTTPGPGGHPPSGPPSGPGGVSYGPGPAQDGPSPYDPPPH